MEDWLGGKKTTEENEEQANKDMRTERTQELKARQMKDPNNEQEKGELSLCNFVRELLQQVQQAWLFLSSSLDPDDNFLILSNSLQYWSGGRPTLVRQKDTF